MAEPHTTQNDDIVGLHNRINRTLVELYKSASANVTAVNVHDFKRTSDYLVDLTLFTDYITSPEFPLDLPDTHPFTHTLSPDPEIPDIENMMVEDLMRLLVRGRGELVLSQSSRNATGLISHDEKRWRAILVQADKFMVEYVAKVTPIDLPESSPETGLQ